MSLFERYQEWQRRQQALKEARLLVREGRRLLRRNGHRMTVALHGELRDSLDGLAGAAARGDHAALPPAMERLDQLLDKHLAFARKSTTRDYIESIGAAVLIALLLRAFVVEAFKIPSGSMIPTLQVGDHIFVNKFIYGVRLPFTNIKFASDYRTPERGEVIVFIHPKEQDKDLIKRVVAVAGDTVEVREHQVFINGQAVPRSHVEGDCQYQDYIEEAGRWTERHCDAWQETVPGTSYTTLYEPVGAGPPQAPIKVPPRSVFVMGDNRDNSSDSRFWGFVPYELIKGKAMFVWWSYGSPVGIRYQRMFGLIR